MALLRHGPNFGLTVAVVTAVLALLFYARTIFELRFLESSSPEPDLGSNQFSSGTLSVGTGTRLKELEALPLPRTITITWRGMLTILLRASWSLGCLCFLSFVVWRRFSIEIPIWLTSLLLVVLILAEIGAFRTMLLERRLLRNGAVTGGKVTTQADSWTRGIFAIPLWRSSDVMYEFQDASQELCLGRRMDWRKHLYEGMPVTVFYERANPSRNVALECSLFEIVAPGH